MRSHFARPRAHTHRGGVFRDFVFSWPRLTWIGLEPHSVSTERAAADERTGGGLSPSADLFDPRADRHLTLAHLRQLRMQGDLQHAVTLAAEQIDRLIDPIEPEAVRHER
jgi:hypothetical protein